MKEESGGGKTHLDCFTPSMCNRHWSSIPGIDYVRRSGVGRHWINGPVSGATPLASPGYRPTEILNGVLTPSTPFDGQNFGTLALLDPEQLYRSPAVVYFAVAGASSGFCAAGPLVLGLLFEASGSSHRATLPLPLGIASARRRSAARDWSIRRPRHRVSVLFRVLPVGAGHC